MERKIRELLSAVEDEVASQVESLLSMRGDVRSKPDGSPVTRADYSMQARLIDLVTDHLGPGALILSEELANDRVRSSRLDYTVVIDPIDGTENFSSGLPEWGVSLGVWDAAGDCAGALLLVPELGLSLRSGQTVDRFHSRIAGYSSGECDELSEALSLPGQRRVLGCAVLNLLNVATGRFRSFSNPCGARIWDLLPGCVLALEQGCTVLVDGTPYDGGLRPVEAKLTVEIQGPSVLDLTARKQARVD